MILVPVSIGELIDKITILEIKLDKIKDEEKHNNVKKELEILETLCRAYEFCSNEQAIKYKDQLKDVNFKLWNIEDEIRAKESLKKFDETFIELARSVYINNDIRAKLKKQINIFFKSDLKEEKFYNGQL